MIDDKYPQFIKVDIKAKEKYLKPIIDNEISIFYKREQTEIFFLAAAIGHLNKNRLPLKDKTDVRLYSTLTHDHKMFIRVLALNEENFDYNILKNGQEVIRIIEEYANGGFKLLYDQVIKNSFDNNLENQIWDMIRKEKK